MKLRETSRDTDLLETLTLRVHLLSLEQVARGWWGRGMRARRTASERLSKLEAAGFLTRHRVNIHPMLPLLSPELEWSPGDHTPELGAVAYRLQQRWTEPLQLTTVCVATRKAANQFGGFGGKFKHRTQLTHDIHLAEVYVRFSEADPTIPGRWKGEEELAKDSPGEKVPDAMILDTDGFPEVIVEFGGAYDRRRVERFHHYAVEKRLRYQIW